MKLFTKHQSCTLTLVETSDIQNTGFLYLIQPDWSSAYKCWKDLLKKEETWQKQKLISNKVVAPPVPYISFPISFHLPNFILER